MCLIIKVGQKMVKNSDTSYQNEIHRVDSPSNKDSKNIILCQGGAGRKFRENGQKQGNLLLCKLRSGQF